MKNLRDRIKENRHSFDEQTPAEGHEVRFLSKIDQEFHHQPNQYKHWIKVAASFVLLIGLASVFYFLNQESVEEDFTTQEKEQSTIPLDNATYYYQNTFNTQFAAISKNYTDTESREMIEESEILIYELQEEYKELEKELKKTGDQRVATAMILNYKSRISILEKLIEKLKFVTQLKKEKNEGPNA